MMSLKLIFTFLIYASTFHRMGAETIEVTYEELKELKVSCPPHDTCSALQPEYNGSLASNECSCDMFCARYGTCCVDSRYKNVPPPNIKPTCRSMVGMDVGYLILDQCPKGGYLQSVFKDLCEEEWDGQNDIIRLIPVTSLFTHITYKNFFCFRCHEANYDFLFWIVKIEYEQREENNESTHVQLEYDSDNHTWVAPVGEDGSIVPVSFPTFTPPSDIFFVPKICRPGVISKCSENWENDTVKAKCDAYMSRTVIQGENETTEYRNPHCALCNFENLDNFICKPKTVTVLSAAERTKFSFVNLLDINLSDGNKVGKTKMCDDNAIWDPNFKKCRTTACALPGYVVKDKKCVPP